MSWGGAREGAGRPKGSTKSESHRRKSKAVAAFDDEWELINAFAKIVKYGDREKCQKFLEEMNAFE